MTGWRARMLLGSGLWMRSQKMVEHVEKGQNMLLVVTRLAGADVIDNHVTDFFPCRALDTFWHIPELLPTARRQLVADTGAPRTPGTLPQARSPCFAAGKLAQPKPG